MFIFMEVGFAKIEDIENILILLKENHIESIKEEDKKDGFVTTNITKEQLKDLIEKENGVVIAKENNKVLAFAFAASWEFWSQWPFFQYMIEKLKDFSFNNEVLSIKNSYQYGPVCVSKKVRGTGVFEKIFFKSLASMKNKYPIMATFINKINPRSYAAHTKKARIVEVGSFSYNNNNYYCMACSTDLKEK